MSHPHTRHSYSRRFSPRVRNVYLYPQTECYCDGDPCLCPPDTAGLARDPVLVKGFYWYDAPPAQAPGFQAWLVQNAALVKVRKTVTSADTSVFGSPNAHIFVLFEVLFPVPWLDAKQFGFPNTADKDTDVTVTSSGAEPQKDPLDKIADGVKEVIPFLGPVSSGVLVAGGLVGLAYIFRKELFSYGIKQVRRVRRHPGNR